MESYCLPKLSNDAKKFQLNGVSDTGRVVGNGSYATVKELEFHGLKCAGKKIHQLLLDSATPQERAAMLQRFTEECELLSHLHHPCVVQFLGVYFECSSQLPVLVMEYLHTTLSACIDRYGVLPETISYGILHDVALGLRYLHERSPPIIHRDLSANNVLLTSSMNGKISDLGVAKILNITPAQMTQKMSTQAPGTSCYMPPEALLARPTYTSKIDSYSYGVMMIHVLCGRWPFPADAFRPDPQNPDGLVPVSEIGRRAEYLKDISHAHPLMGLIQQCLSNFPKCRPEAFEIFHQITDIMSRASLTHQCKMEMQTRINSLEEQVKQLSTLNQKKQSQIESLVAQKQSEDVALRDVERLSVQNLQRKENSSQRPPIPRQPAPIPRQPPPIPRQPPPIQQQQPPPIQQRQPPIQQQQPQQRKPPPIPRQPAPIPRQPPPIPQQPPPIQQQQPQQRKPPPIQQQQPPPIQQRQPPPIQQRQPPPIQQRQPPPIQQRQAPPIQKRQPPPIPQRKSHLPIDSQSLLLHPHSILRWRRVADLPVAMSEHHIVRIGSTVYCGGGYTDKRDTARQVFQYNPDQDTWSQLPICPTVHFGLTQLDGKLVTVGGRRIDQPSPINDVYVFQESETWENSIIPPLPTARFYPTVVNYKSAVIVSGGLTHWRTDSKLKARTSAVEVFQTKTYQWYRAEPLPVAHSNMSCAILKDTCYLIGGDVLGAASRRAYCTSISNLISRALPPDHPETSSTPQASPSPTWQVLPECPLYYSTAAELGGCLLAIGGMDNSKSSSSTVHMYSPGTNSWMRVSSGDLPVPRWGPTATQLEGREVIFVGGKIKQRSPTKTVYIGTM